MPIVYKATEVSAGERYTLSYHMTVAGAVRACQHVSHKHKADIGKETKVLKWFVGDDINGRLTLTTEECEDSVLYMVKEVLVDER